MFLIFKYLIVFTVKSILPLVSVSETFSVTVLILFMYLIPLVSFKFLASFKLLPDNSKFSAIWNLASF